MAVERSTSFPFQVNGEAREIRVHTDKVSRGLRASATVVKPSADGLGYSFLMFHDYSATVLAEPLARGTQKAIDDLHARACDKIDDVRKAADAHYAKLAEREAA